MTIEEIKEGLKKSGYIPNDDATVTMPLSF